MGGILLFFSEYRWQKIFVVVMIMFVAGILRIPNIAQLRNVDEPNIIDHAVAIADGQWHVRWYYWPAQSLMRIDGFVFRTIHVWHDRDVASPHTIAQEYRDAPQQWNVYARGVSVLFGCFGVLLVIALSTILARDWRAGIIGGIFLAIAPLHVVHSRFATPDAPLTTLLLALTLCGTIILHTPLSSAALSRWLLLTSGAVLGFAIATKYTGGLGIGILAFAALMRWCNDRHTINVQIFFRWSTWRNILLVACSALVIHTVLNPYWIGDWRIIIKQFLFEANPKRLGVDWSHQDWVFLRNVRYYLVNLFRWSGSLITLIAFASMVVMTKYLQSTQRRDAIYFAGIFCIILVALSALGLHWSRWALPLVPFVAIFASASFFLFLKHLSSKILRWSIGIFGMILMITPPLLVSIVRVHTQGHASTTDAMEKILATLPPDAHIVADTYFISSLPRQQFDQLQIRMYDTPLAEWSQKGVDYIIVKSNRFTYAKREPERYPQIVQFFHDLETHATAVESAHPFPMSLLRNRRDDAVWRFILQRKNWPHMFDVRGGTTLKLYKISSI